MVDDMKYSGGGGQSSRQEVEQWERKLGDAQNAVERTKLRHQRMTKVFIDVRAGIEHMADKLETVKLDVPAVPISDETIVDVMLQCDSKLVKMFEVVGMLPDEDPKVQDRDLFSRESAEPAADSGYNVRVALQDEHDVDDDDDDDLDGMEADIPDRTAMKKAHGAMLDKATAKSKRKKKGKFGGDATPKSPTGGGAAPKGLSTVGGKKLDTD
jgi:coiled-coil domain-containing protein 151